MSKIREEVCYVLTSHALYHLHLNKEEKEEKGKGKAEDVVEEGEGENLWDWKVMCNGSRDKKGASFCCFTTSIDETKFYIGDSNATVHAMKLDHTSSHPSLSMGMTFNGTLNNGQWGRITKCKLWNNTLAVAFPTGRVSIFTLPLHNNHTPTIPLGNNDTQLVHGK